LGTEELPRLGGIKLKDQEDCTRHRKPGDKLSPVIGVAAAIGAVFPADSGWRADTREKGLNALRQLIDEIDAGRYPGLYLVVTGTSAFFDGPQGVQRLAPLAQRLHTDFATDARYDNPRAIQVRLPGFDLGMLARVGARVRDLFVEEASSPERVSAVVDDAYLDDNGVKGVAALRMARDMNINPKSAFVLLHKLREAMGAVRKGKVEKTGRGRAMRWKLGGC
jgi:hypothetical protein